MVRKLMIKESNNKTVYDDIVKKVLTPYLEPYAKSAIKLFDSPFSVYNENKGLVTIGESVLGNIAYNYAKENGYSSAVLNLVGNYYDVDSALVISVKDGRQRTYPRFKNIARNLSGSLKKELDRLSIKLNDVIRDIANELIKEFKGVTNESINRGNSKMVRKINESVYGYEDTKWIDIGGEMGENGAIWSFQDLKDFWDNNHDSDPLLVLYKEQDPDFDFEEWFYDTIGTMKEYEEPIDDINDIELSEDQIELLYDIADRYSGVSKPVSGNWKTEVAHEQGAIADELHISQKDAKRVMIDYLGFDERWF